jgi:Acetyltransferase (GNAT) family
MTLGLTRPQPSLDTIAIETVERDAWLDLFAAVPLDYAEACHVRSKRFDTFALLANKGVPISEFNRTLALGINEPLTEEVFDRLLEWLISNAAPTWAIQLVPEASRAVVDGWMDKRRIKQSGTGWAKFQRNARSAEAPSRSTDLRVGMVGPSESMTFGKVVADGFGFPATVIPWFAALVERPNWRAYLAYEDDVPVGCGSLYIGSGWGWLGIEVTLRDYRGRGAQTALINRRVADGIDAGLIGFTAETGNPLPDEERQSISYQNYLRAGFTKAYTRVNYRASS